MSILYGDILLNSDSEIQGDNGDLKSGDAKEQQTGAIINANSGNFRKYPTLGANLILSVDGPMNSRSISNKVQNALFSDGWRAKKLNIESDLDSVSVTVADVIKVTDETTSLL